MSLLRPADWPPALALLVDLAAEDPVGDGARRAASMGDDDWAEFAELAVRRHRIAPLLGHAPASLPVPQDIRAALAEAARDSGRQVLARMADTRCIVERFAAEGVTPVVLKGWPLALRLYGNAAARHARDLDLHIRPEALERCHAAMLDLGYVPPREYAQYAHLVGSQTLLSEMHELAYVDPATARLVEVSWRAYSVRGYAEVFDAPGTTQVQETPIGPLRVPSDTADLIYLSVHGAMHMWSRLKWLTDIDRLARNRGAERLETDLEAARTHDAGTAVAVGLVLSARLFGSPLPGSLAAPDPAVERAVAAVLRRLAVSERALYRLSARIDFYRYAIGQADTLSQQIGFLRFGSWRRLRFWLARHGIGGQRRSAAP